MISQQFLVADNSSAANFKSWASALSNFIRACGWTNSTDTGQLNGQGPDNWAGVSTAPTAGNYYYEIFKPGDGLSNFYLKLEYGNNNQEGGNNWPCVRISASYTTNGAGALTGIATAAIPLSVNASGLLGPDAVSKFECDFSGDSGRLSVVLWRTNWYQAQGFCVQRALNASGSPTSDYVSIWGFGNTQKFQYGNGYYNASTFQVSLDSLAVLSYFPKSTDASNGFGIPAPMFNVFNQPKLSARNKIPVWFLTPVTGLWDYPCTAFGVGAWNDITDGVPFTITNQYGQTKTYMPVKCTAAQAAVGKSTINETFACQMVLCVEFD